MSEARPTRDIPRSIGAIFAGFALYSLLRWPPINCCT